MKYAKELLLGALTFTTFGAYKMGRLHEKQGFKAKDSAIRDAEKFAKEFTSEQYNTFESQMKSLIRVVHLLKNGDIKGIFSNCVQPIDWIKFATNIHHQSLEHKSAESVLNACITKVCGIEPTTFKYITTALSNEYGNIMVNAYESKLKITGTSKSLVKLSIASNDHTTSIFQANTLIKKFTDEAKNLDDSLIENNFNTFVRASVSESIPELHQAYASSE